MASSTKCATSSRLVIDTTPYGTVFSLLIHKPKEKKETDVKEVDKVSKAMTEYLEENKFTMFFPNDMNSWMLVGGKEHWDNLSERMGIRKGTDYDAKKQRITSSSTRFPDKDCWNFSSAWHVPPSTGSRKPTTHLSVWGRKPRGSQSTTATRNRHTRWKRPKWLPTTRSK